MSFGGTWVSGDNEDRRFSVNESFRETKGQNLSVSQVAKSRHTKPRRAQWVGPRSQDRVVW
jgi:hypothetical protein